MASVTFPENAGGIPLQSFHQTPALVLHRATRSLQGLFGGNHPTLAYMGNLDKAGAMQLRCTYTFQVYGVADSLDRVDTDPDRFAACWIPGSLDLVSESEAVAVLTEAGRILLPGGSVALITARHTKQDDPYWPDLLVNAGLQVTGRNENGYRSGQVAWFLADKPDQKH